MGKFSPDVPDEPEPAPPPVDAAAEAEAAARRKEAAQKKRKGRRATLLSKLTEEDIEQAVLGRPTGTATRTQM